MIAAAKNYKQNSPLKMGPGKVSFKIRNLSFELDFNLITKNIELNIQAIFSVVATITFNIHNEIEIFF